MKYLLFALSLSLSLTRPSFARVTESELNSTFEIFEELYADDLPVGDVLLFNDSNGGTVNWLDYDIYRAAYHYSDGKHFIWVFGGLINAEFMSVDGLALILCHELGHGFGGPPYKTSGSSTEGQSDYYGAGECLTQFFKATPRNLSHIEESHPARDLCEGAINFDLCLRKLAAIDVQRQAFLTLEGVATAYDTYDPTIALSTSREDTFYPSQQCRIDTYVAAALGRRRPRCWYSE